MDNNNFKENRLKLVTDSNYMNAFRNNVRMYDIPLRELSDITDISYDTLKSFLYGDAQDCKLSMAIKLAKAFGCSIDELVGSDTIPQEAKNSIAMLNLLPPQFTKFVRWSIRNNFMRRETQSLIKSIPVMKAEFNENLQYTTNITTTTVDAPDNIFMKAFLGIKIPCENFMPLYFKDDIILVANDRKPKHGEHIIVAYKKDFWIVENDNHIIIDNGKVNDKAYYIGYICFVERN